MLAGCNDNKNSWRKHRHKLGRPCLFSTARRVKVCNRNNQNDVFFRIQKSVFRRFSFRRSPSPVAARIRRLSLLTYRRRAPAAGARVGARVLACDEVTRPLARLPSPVHCVRRRRRAVAASFPARLCRERLIELVRRTTWALRQVRAAESSWLRLDPYALTRRTSSFL